jgi:hypothetical protein
MRRLVVDNVHSWQTRLVVKALKYLDTHAKLPPHTDQAEVKRHHYEKMSSIYRMDLLNHLRAICWWILNILPLIGPPKQPNPPRGILSSDVLLPSNSFRDCQSVGLGSLWPTPPEQKSIEKWMVQESKLKGHRWYCSLIIWYIMRQRGAVFEDDRLKERLWETLPLFETMKNEQNDFTALIRGGSTLCFIRWYHSHSFVQICKKLEIEDPARFRELRIDLHKHQKYANEWQVKAEKSWRLFGQGRFINHSLDPEIAYLSFLSDEIGMGNRPLLQQGSSCSVYARDLIKKRKETSILNPGRTTVLRWDPAHDMHSAKARPAPWELDCMGHHVSMAIEGISSNPDESMQAYKAFILCDYTFMATMDQSRYDAIGQWWDMTTSSIVCATILDQWQRKERPQSTSTLDNYTERESPYEGLELPPRIENGPLRRGSSFADPIKRFQTPKSVQFDEPEQKELPKDDTRKILEILQEKTKPKEESEGFVWMKRRPGTLYHADSTVQSLEDTPQVYELKQTKNVMIRPNVKKYFEEHGITSPDWDLESITRDIPPLKLLHISCFDFTLKADDNDTPEIGISCTKGRIDKGFWRISMENQPEVMGLIEQQKEPSLWLLYFMGKADRHPKWPTLSIHFRQLLQEEKCRSSLLKAYQTSLFSVLNDSVSYPY